MGEAKHVCAKCNGKAYELCKDIHHMKKYDLAMTHCSDEVWICSVCLTVDIVATMMVYEETDPELARIINFNAKRLKAARDKEKKENADNPARDAGV